MGLRRFSIGSVELGLSNFPKWRAVKQVIQSHSRNGGKQGYLQEKMWKLKTQDNRIDSKVIILLKCRYISAVFA